jgi:sugar lactone lactonase YvrE
MLIVHDCFSMTKLLLLTWLLLTAGIGLAQPTSFRLDKMMGTPIYGPRDVAVDRWGNMYVADNGVNKLDSTGRYLANFRPISSGASVAEVAVDADGNMYMGSVSATTPGDVIRKYSPDGQLLMHCGTNGYLPGELGILSGLSIGPTGTIYAGDGNGRQLFRFDKQGNTLPMIVLPSEPGSSSLKDIAVDATGSVYVLYDNYIVTKLTATGQLITRIPLGNATGASVNTNWTERLCLDAAGNMLVSISQGGILRYSPTGTLLGYINYSFSNSTHTSMAFDAAGKLYVTDFTHSYPDHLYKFSPAGTLLKRWGYQYLFAYVRQDEAGNMYAYDGRSTVYKYNAAGQLTLTFNAYVNQYLGGFAVDARGYIYVLNTSDTASELTKYNPQGKQVARFTSFGFPGNYQHFNGLAVSSSGIIYLSEEYGGHVRKLSSQGQLLGTIGSPGVGPGELYAPRAVAVDLGGNVYVTDYDGRRVQKFAPSGQVLRQFGPSPPANSSIAVGEVDMEVDGRGNVYVASFYHEGIIFAADGSSQTAMPSYSTAVSVNHDGTRLLNLGPGVVRFYASGQQPLTNSISGQLYHDVNRNCQRDSTELPLAGIPVIAEPGSYYGMTDETGHYTVAVDTGRYQVRPLPPVNEAGRQIELSCALPSAVTFRGYNNSVADVDFGHQVSTNPFMRVTIASNRRRRCFRNQTVVTYHNDGFVVASNVAVAVALPPQVVFVSASQPYTRNAAGQYVFAVGTVPIGQGGSIVLQDSVVCGDPSIRGLTVCTKAWITPANAYPIPAGWNQSSIAVQGRAEAANQTRFVVRNTGRGDMVDSLALRVYQDTDLALQHRYRLAAGDSLVLRMAASRPVVRVEADQPVGHPTQRLASATVEVRALGPVGQPNAAMLAMPPNAPGPEAAEDCQPILDSYDPNDKQVLPAGVTAQHYTPTGVPLHYRVRFQNTGSDDAYRVALVDTLSTDLDLRTLRVEAASHPYRLSVTGKGQPVLTFSFDGIGLPPSSRDAAGSNGFVQFSVQPKAGLAAKTLIENYADIFFDYNSAVRTLTTTSRIYDLPTTVMPAVAVAYADAVVSPVITQLTPAQGRAGTLVTISGQRLASVGAVPQVSFNGVSTPVLNTTSTALTVRVPVGASTGPVQVLTSDGGTHSPQAFTVYQPPTITALAPAEGVVGTLLTLTGTAFSPFMEQDTVWIGGVAMRVQQASATSMQVVVPPGASTGSVQLATLGGQVTSAQTFTVWTPPVLLSFSPARGKAGDVVTLTGSSFAPTARSEVAFGAGIGSVVQASGTSLQVRVPASAQTGKIRVQTPGGLALSTTDFTFLPAPGILAFTPGTGSVGEIITLTGTNFLVDGRPDTVYFNNQRAEVLGASATTITVRVPYGVRSGLITVTGTGGHGSSATPFTVLSLSPADAIVVYPNPTHGDLTLDWLRANFMVQKAQLFNVLGASVFTADLSQQATTSLQVPLTTAQPGLYLLVIQTARGPILKKITVY